MSTETKRLEDVPTEALAILAREQFSQAMSLAEKSMQVADSAVEHFAVAGDCLEIVKSRTPHGGWLPWLNEHWPYTQQHANNCMRISNYKRAGNLTGATSYRECLRLISEQQEAAGTKRTRKAPAEPAPEVIDNRPAPKPVEDVPTVTKSFFDSDELPPEEPPPLPKTNTLHSPTTQQRIDRGPEPAPPTVIECGAGLTPLQQVHAQHTFDESLQDLTSGYEGEQARRIARKLRARADELDPPEETKAPTLPQMRSIIEQRAKLPPADDRHLKPPVAAAASEWAAHKTSMPKAKRYQSRTSWEACLSRMATLSLDRGADVVCDMIQRAIASGYQGWEFETAAPRGGRPAPRNTNIRTGRNFDAEMGPPIHLADVEEF
jgi:hypothetical protein